MPTSEQYEHYSKCQLPIEKCVICRYVWGNYTKAEQHKYRKILRHGKQTLAIYKCDIAVMNDFEKSLKEEQEN